MYPTSHFFIEKLCLHSLSSIQNHKYHGIFKHNLFQWTFLFHLLLPPTCFPQSPFFSKSCVSSALLSPVLSVSFCPPLFPLLGFRLYSHLFSLTNIHTLQARIHMRECQWLYPLYHSPQTKRVLQYNISKYSQNFPWI